MSAPAIAPAPVVYWATSYARGLDGLDEATGESRHDTLAEAQAAVGTLGFVVAESARSASLVWQTWEWEVGS